MSRQFFELEGQGPESTIAHVSPGGSPVYGYGIYVNNAARPYAYGEVF